MFALGRIISLRNNTNDNNSNTSSFYVWFLIYISQRVDNIKTIME